MATSSGAPFHGYLHTTKVVCNSFLERHAGQAMIKTVHVVFKTHVDVGTSTADFESVSGAYGRNDLLTKAE